MRLDLIPSARQRRMPWKNGLGWTTEVLVHPPGTGLDGAPFDWRASIAEIDSDCDFSAFPGYDRHLMLLHGDGIELTAPGFDTATLRERGRVTRFAGEVAPHCRVIGGPSRDFNLMTRTHACAGQLMLRPLTGSMVLFAERDVSWLLHALSGQARCTHADADVLVEQGAALHIQFDPGDGRLLIRGGGELVLARIEPAAAVR